MSVFSRKQGVLYAEKTPLPEIAAKYGTPVYVYSKAALLRNWAAFNDHLPKPHRAHFAVKANSNLAVLQTLAEAGAGFDVVSGGEIARVLKAGGVAEKIVFSGVAKSVAEIEYALQQGIGQFNVESRAELDRISEVAVQSGKTANVSFRVNPDVDAKTHPYIATGLEANKFGIPMDDAISTYQYASQLKGIRITGADCHIGSQLTSTEPFMDALDRMLTLVDELAELGIELQHLDMGGGLGVTYYNEHPPAVGEYIDAMLERMKDHPQLALYLEPGRAIAANAGVMLTRVEYLKANRSKHFVMVDAGMNDMLRPSLYQAYHKIENVKESPAEEITCDIVGPVCETGDFLGQTRRMRVAAGDLLAVMSAGAYGFVMSSNYNTRGRPAEVMVDGNQSYLIRKRETLEDLWQGETLLP